MQLAFLGNAGCQAIQGFLYSPPVAAGELSRQIQSGSAFSRERPQPRLRLVHNEMAAAG